MTNGLRPADPYIQSKLKRIVSEALLDGREQRALLVNQDYEVAQVLRYSAIKENLHVAAKKAMEDSGDLWAVVHIGLLADRDIVYVSIIENGERLFGMSVRYKPPRGTKWVKISRLAELTWHRVWKEEDLPKKD